MKNNKSYTLEVTPPKSEFASTNALTPPEQLSKSEEALGEYDPFAHRQVKKPTSDLGALAHLLKSSLGSGILAMPRAFLNGGIFFGLFGTLIVGFICTHCVQMLVDSSHVLCRRLKKPLMSFPETAYYSFSSGPTPVRKFARAARIFCNTALVVTYCGGNTVYIVIIARSIEKERSLSGASKYHNTVVSICVPQTIMFIVSLRSLVVQSALFFGYFGACSIYLVLLATTLLKILEHYDMEINIRLLILILWVPVLILCTIRPLKWLVPFSVIANICIAVVFGITLYYVFNEIKSPTDLPAVGTVANMPLFFSTVIFAMEGIGVVMPLENQMKTPQHFTGCPGVLAIGMTVVVILYAVIGFFGYLRFGSETEATITINLLNEYPDDGLAQAVQYLIAIAIYLTYALQFYVPTSIIWDGIKGRFEKSRHHFYHYIMRFVLVTGTVLLAVAVPQLGPIIDLVGAVCFSILGLLLPAIIDTVTRWDQGDENPSAFGPANWILWKNIVIIILATLALIAGTYTSILEIIETY